MMAINADGFQGIWPPHRMFYIESMLFNSQAACASISIVADAITALGQGIPRETIDTHAVLNEIQSIVLHGAAVSRYFWPVRPGHEGRAEELRQSFEVTEESPLYSRSLRNALEHFDERLDKYLASGIFGHIIPEFFGTSGKTDVPTHVFRAYYLDRGEFQLLDEKYPIPPLAEALWSLNNSLLEQSGRG
ncbi:MAG: hypothetical protein ACYC0F_09280 [Rhodanobacter sp.]